MSCSSQGGVSIMTKDECQAACEQLGRDFNPTQLVNDKICYMSSTKKCRQTGSPCLNMTQYDMGLCDNEPVSSLICRKKGYYGNTYHDMHVGVIYIQKIKVENFLLLLRLLGAETCFDGNKNQGEDEVDCGGPCSPCRK